MTFLLFPAAPTKIYNKLQKFLNTLQKFSVLVLNFTFCKMYFLQYDNVLLVHTKHVFLLIFSDKKHKSFWWWCLRNIISNFSGHSKNIFSIMLMIFLHLLKGCFCQLDTDISPWHQFLLIFNWLMKIYQYELISTIYYGTEYTGRPLLVFLEQDIGEDFSLNVPTALFESL